MIHKVIQLGKENVTLTTYIHDQSEQGNFQIAKRPGVIIMPGSDVGNAMEYARSGRTPGRPAGGDPA